MIKKNPFAALTWQDLESWVGLKTLSRGKAYQRSAVVQDLALAGEDRLIAWVQGTKRYATEVEIIGGEPSSGCTCPVGIGCKHGVAVPLGDGEALGQAVFMRRSLRLSPNAIRMRPFPYGSDWSKGSSLRPSRRLTGVLFRI